MTAKLSLFLASILMLLRLHGGDWDFEYWQQLRFGTVERGSSSLYTSIEARFNRDASTFYFLRATENYKYSLLDWLNLEFHYSFIHHHPRGTASFTNLHRFEFEANPYWTLCNQSTIQIRNRYELNKSENNPVWQSIIRERFRWKFPIENCGKLTGIGFANELFYHINLRYFSQNRLVPLFLTFTLSEKVSLEVFTMVRNFYSGNKWYRSMVAGTNLEF